MTLHLSEILLDPSRWQWRWEDMCGPKGLQPWSPIEHDLGLCFQQLCLHIPVLFLFSIVSAYFFGRQIEFVRRGSKQLLAINARIFISVMLALLPIVEIYIYLSMTNVKISPINYFLSMTEFLTWFIHLGFLIALKNRFGVSCRGPISVCILWSIIFVVTIISFRSHMIIYRNEESSFHVDISMVCIFSEFIFQLFYALTLIPGDSDAELITYPVFFYAPIEEIDERSPLLGRSNGYSYTPFMEENGPEYLGSAMESTSFLSRLLFYWVNPLMYKGLQRKIINSDSLFDLPPDLESITLAQKLDKALIGNVDRVRQHSRGLTVPVEYDSIAPPDLPSDDNSGNKGHIKRHNVSLLKALHVCFALQFYGIGVLRLLADCAGFAGPLLLNKLVSFIENKAEDIKWGYYYAFALCGTTLIAAFANAHFSFRMGLVALKIRGALVTTIYKKTLTACPKILNEKFNVGEVVNFMSTDTDRIVNSCPSFHAFWSIPFQLAVSLYLLYSQVGLAFLAGVAFSVVLLPINKIIANKIGKLSTLMMRQKDERVKLMTEIIRGIRTVKYHAWETHFIGLISKCRDEELKYLKARKYLDALCVFFWAITPVLISILTFATYVLLGNKLTAATVFTTMALLNMLIGPLNAFPWVLNGVTEAWVSIKRIQALLDLPDLDIDHYYDQSLLDSQSNACIVIKNGKFSWGKNPNREQKVERKTSTLSIKTVNIQDGDETDSDTVLREGGSEEKTKVVRFFDQEDFYLSSINLVVKKGEFVGIMGAVGSGKSSLLAGILAELEREGGNIAVADNEYGFGFVSQEPWLQRGTIRDNILFGKAYDESRYQSVLRACCLHDDLYMLPGGDETGVGDGGNTLSGGQKARVALARAVYQDKPIYIMDDILSAVDVNVAKHIFQHCLMGLLKNKTKILCTHHTQYLLYADYVVVMHKGMIFQQGKPGEILSDLEEIILTSDKELEESSSVQESELHRSVSIAKDAQLDNDSVLEEETKESGSVEFKVYTKYWTAIGHLLSIAILLAITMMQSSKNVTDLWLSYWVSNESNKTEFRVLVGADSDLNVKYYLMVYVILAAVSTVFTLFRAFLFAYGGITAAGRIHKQLLKTIMKAKVTFFDISPLGRILNRFSSDTYTIDDSLPFILNILLAQLFGVVGAITVTIYGLPWLCLVLAPLFPIYHWLQNHYRLTSRELKRLSSLTLSPVYSHFNETLQGLSTIRAFRATQRFKFDNEERVENSQKTQFASHAAGQWLALRLQFIGVAMVTGVGIIAVVQHQFDVADSGLVGLAISYALSITGLLSGVVNAFTETEREMIAVERVSQYIEEVEPEKISNEEMEAVNPPYAWPSQGVIAFNNVVLKYRNHLAPSLKGVSFETRPAEKIGVVGRTGAGKSSLLTALFRLVEIYSGSIYIDTVNIANLDLTALRSRLSIIPQKPFLYSGTVAENLDPLEEYRPTELWGALKRCNLDSVVRRMGGLEASLSSAGQNLSVGQQQLLCLARALLHKTKILCIDEATANVDFQTDRIIQQTIRSSFRQSTVITIAHRVQTIMDCDRVLVMGDGQILEFDTPKNLMQEPNSYFYHLASKEM